VTKRIEFCYGHRMMDYEGCASTRTGTTPSSRSTSTPTRLDGRNMVADFGDIKRIVKGWIDRELDHKMILRKDDPLTAALQKMGEPMYVLDSNPTAERIAQLIYDKSREQGLPVSRVTVWETPTSWATYTA
jgi:6-pyruvoyltetrahydropterin/6-carboxytetrahydropterin synthase